MANVQLDPSIIQRAVGPEVPLNDLGQIYASAANFRAHQAAIALQEEQLQQKQATDAAYKAATNPDGTVDQGKLMYALSQGGAGSNIPTVQKAMLDAQHVGSQVKKEQAETEKTVQGAMYESLSKVDSSISALASNPNTTEKDVYGEVGRLVNAGAFNMQAKHVGQDPDTYARNLLSTMPVGNPQALHQWLIQAGARVADATERLKLQLPKFDAQDSGGVINNGTIDQMTGQRTAGSNVQKTATPGDIIQAQTQRRGQDLTYMAQKENNEVTREAMNSKLEQTPQGLVTVNLGTGQARPVVGPNGQPVLAPDSNVYKNAQMADKMKQMIPMARDLLTQSTASGAGAAIDKVANFVGLGTKGGDAASALEALSGWMTTNVPRFEGPQSDKDTETYRIMAGMVGDRTKPLSTRMQALDTVEKIMQQYGGQRTLPFSGPPGTAPATVVAPRPPVATPYTGPDRRGAPPQVVAPVQTGTPAPGAPNAQQRPDINSFFVR